MRRPSPHALSEEVCDEATATTERNVPSMPRNQGNPQENLRPKWVPTVRTPTRREVLAVTCGGLWALLDLLALQPELATVIAAVVVLLVLFVDLDPLPRSGESRSLPSPRGAADDNPSVNPPVYLPNRGE